MARSARPTLDDLAAAANARRGGVFPRRITIWVTDERVARAAAAAIQGTNPDPLRNPGRH
ncbi:hypothetical protein [Actinopolymorpha cephalotaxi]|nr:hypothetical protein [Actinopolymorpha cephalotaxi]NYH85350.1 hypothetical protein [Actinopolymorpha cephalotaxi]